MIGIVDYGLGNVKAFANIYNELNVRFVVATTPQDLDSISRVILPGVGAFDQAMKRLQESGMREHLDDLVLNKGMPVLGVCVGMQILMGTSEEGTARGLGWIEGEVIKFTQDRDAQKMPIPHMGWNNLRPIKDDPLFEGLDEQSRFYFLHSYFTRCKLEENILAVTNYGAEFACAVGRESIYGVQFHPEKSHRYGIRLLKNFSEL